VVVSQKPHLPKGDEERTARVLALTRALEETRRAIATSAAREMAIMKALDSLGALPPSISHDVQSESG
jgi:hypothetical protein